MTPELHAAFEANRDLDEILSSSDIGLGDFDIFVEPEANAFSGAVLKVRSDKDIRRILPNKIESCGHSVQVFFVRNESDLRCQGLKF